MARKVFVGGSIRVNTLPSSVKQILDAEIAAGSLFIVSDADGVDEEVQKHLYERKYRNVEIYTMRTSRKNIGNWPVKYHEAPSGVYGGAYHAIKDREMDRAADAGIMIWDGKSSGTRNNIVELLQAGKPTLVSNVALKKNELYLTLDEFKIGLPSHTKNIQEVFLKAPKIETRELSTIDKKQIYPQGQDMETYPIDGLIVLRGWLNPQEQEKLLKTIDGRPWSNALKRKTQHEGWRYSYDRRPLNETDYLGDISPDLAALVTRLQADGGTTFKNLQEQAIVNNYEKSEGIGTHIDHVGNFGPTVVSLTLGSAANMEFARAGKTVDVRLEPGDICIMTGDARYKWTHTIKGHEQRRVSVTYRSIADRELVAKVTKSKDEKMSKSEANLTDELFLPDTTPTLDAMNTIQKAVQDDKIIPEVDLNNLFDTPAERPPLPEAGKWHQNWFSNMKPYETTRVRPDGITAYTPEHDYQIEKSADPAVRRLIAALGTVDKFGKPIPQDRITGHAAKRFWREIGKAGGEMLITKATLIEKWGLPEHFLADPDFAIPGPERVGDYINVKTVQRDDWREVRQAHMLEIQRYRFSPETKMAQFLANTGRTEICEWNNWSDKTWGRDIQTGEGQDLLGKMVMRVREENRARGLTVDLSVAPKREPGWLLPHVLGRKDMTAEIAEIGKKFKNLDPKSCGVQDAEAYSDTPHVAIVGSRKHENDPIRMERARWASRTFAESGFVINTGGAEGPDTAAKQGAIESKAGANALEISHPYERVSKGSRDPGNYVLTQPQLKAAAHEFIRGITDNFDRISQFARDLQGRDVTQVTSRDGKNWVKGVFYSAPEKSTGEIDSGTRFAVYTARCAPALGGPVIPTYNMDLNWETYRSAVVSIANEQRVVIGKKPLPEDWSPEHESYLKVIGKDPVSQAKQAETQKMAEEKQELAKVAAQEAQLSARRLMPQIREAYSQAGITATFKEIKSGDSLEGLIMKIDKRVLAVGDSQTDGLYTLVDLNKCRIKGEVELNDTVRLTRGTDGLMDVDIKERVAEKEHVTLKGR